MFSNKSVWQKNDAENDQTMIYGQCSSEKISCPHIKTFNSQEGKATACIIERKALNKNTLPVYHAGFLNKLLKSHWHSLNIHSCEETRTSAWNLPTSGTDPSSQPCSPSTQANEEAPLTSIFWSQEKPFPESFQPTPDSRNESTYSLHTLFVFD